jgi:23S rRNA pseudouridine1911/1915/1917 synthase
MRILIDPVAAGSRLDKLLVDKVPGLGRAGAKRLFAEGRVRVHWAEDKWRKGMKGDVAVAGEIVELELDGAATEGAAPEPGAPLTVLLETETALVLDKPAGQPTAPLAPGELETLANALVARYPELAGIGFSPREPGLVHRLDTETSGVVVAARTVEAFEALSRALKEERLDKRYLLICPAADLPESGTIELPLAPHPKDRRRVYACAHPRDVIRYAPRPATTSYRVLRTEGTLALVEARAPKASRHQIRAHFAAIGHPLVGDTLYGGAELSGLARHALHAHYVAWSGDKVVPAFAVHAPLPADMLAIVGDVPVAAP